ncbi:MAG: alanine--tRNA ligase [Planctomycetota bacterium]
MKPLTVAEIRERYLRFFEERGHQRLPSDSLVPRDDPTLLFTGAGMNQFKDMFMGKGSLPYRRVTTAQKCLRVPDLENVGLTPRHHTFFEMLGNFSFGDYFKKECIPWEWEFFSRELGIPERQMVVTVYTDDDEAWEIWHRDVGLEPERIFRFGEKENFWPAEAPSKGPNGPCGPCSEIYFDARPDEPYPAHEGLESLPDDRFTEIGNCVFTQFERKPDGALEPLPQRNIDVGLGLERIAAVLAGAPNNFETDLFQPFLQWIAERSGKPYQRDRADDVRMRRITDHVRALVFCIADGAVPSNEGRGYVVRKILRRAARDGYDLGIEGAFLHQMVDVVGAAMGDAYPEVREHAGQCRMLIRSEEESFAAVYRQGAERLARFLADQTMVEGPLAGSGEFAFELHDTHGFPVDITRQIMADRGFVLDEAGFEAAMEAQRQRARAAAASGTDAVFAESAAMQLRAAGVPATEFVGYDRIAEDSTIVALLDAEQKPVESLVGDGFAVVGRTPFYAEGGGQVGDRGTITAGASRAAVHDTTSQDGFHLHRLTVADGTLTVGQDTRLEVDAVARRATERNHTATHLLHAALKQVLGDHVNQAGSLVAPDRLRFDFTHGDKLTRAQVANVEELVNAVVMDSIDVQAKVRSMDEARREGFVALFGEKYGDEVRTLAVGGFSKELCGGTHVRNSGNIGSFRVISDAAISAGTRRIEAATGAVSRSLADLEREQLSELAQLLKAPPGEVATRTKALVDEVKKLRKDLAKALAPDPAQLRQELEQKASSVDGVRVALLVREGLDVKLAQDLLNRAAKSMAPFLGVVLSPAADHVVVAAAATSEVADRAPAVELVRAATGELGGGGGGKPEKAQGRGKDPSRIDDAVRAVRERLSAAGLGT